MVLFEFVCCRICLAGCLEGLAYVVAQICSGLVFIVYASDFCISVDELQLSCSFGRGATFNVLSLCCYVAAGIVLACSPKPTPLFHK